MENLELIKSVTNRETFIQLLLFQFSLLACKVINKSPVYTTHEERVLRKMELMEEIESMRPGLSYLFCHKDELELYIEKQELCIC